MLWGTEWRHLNNHPTINTNNKLCQSSNIVHSRIANNKLINFKLIIIIIIIMQAKAQIIRRYEKGEVRPATLPSSVASRCVATPLPYHSVGIGHDATSSVHQPAMEYITRSTCRISNFLAQPFWAMSVIQVHSSLRLHSSRRNHPASNRTHQAAFSRTPSQALPPPHHRRYLHCASLPHY
jgi:hypothetical protein